MTCLIKITLPSSKQSFRINVFVQGYVINCVEFKWVHVQSDILTFSKFEISEN